MSRVARKDPMVKSASGSVREREHLPPVIDYSRMSRDELVDHFIDENGLAQFVDTQQSGVPREDWNWSLIARDLMAFSHYLQFSPSYLQELYEMQSARRSEGLHAN